MSKVNNPKRQFAIETVKRLRESGYQALWAGGCVRDALLNIDPKDYDVATDARPDQVRKVFGFRRTLDIGASFGVVAITNKNKRAGIIEVATFRSDGGYSDGRHPDSVVYTNAEEDAKRRDFTINGMFFDPIHEKVIDYVGGRSDLANGQLRCIGEPEDRFAEDKLRMLRAVRFAARFDFAIEEKTIMAIQNSAETISVVSKERIAAEMRHILCHPNRGLGLSLLQSTHLRDAVFFDPTRPTNGFAESHWRDGLQKSELIQVPQFELALAAVLWGRFQVEGIACVEELAAHWKLSNKENTLVQHLLKNEAIIRNATESNWPVIQRILIQPNADLLIEFADLVSIHSNTPKIGIQFCREKLKLESHLLNPTPLITGDDLIHESIPSGPHFRVILDAVRDAQLEKSIETREQALALAHRIWNDRE